MFPKKNLIPVFGPPMFPSIFSYFPLFINHNKNINHKLKNIPYDEQYECHDFIKDKQDYNKKFTKPLDDNWIKCNF
jgi:hypothetical protein